MMNTIIENIIYPNAMCGVIIDDCLWFMNHVANALMKMRILDGVVEEWYQIEPYDLLQSTLFLDMKLYKNKWLVLIPDICGKHIVFFDIESKQQERLDIPKDLYISKNVMLDGEIVLFSKYPQKGFRIIALNLDKRELVEKTQWMKIIDNATPSEIDRVNSISDVTYYNLCLWILIKNSKYILKFDPTANKCQCVEVDLCPLGKITSGEKAIYVSDARRRTVYRMIQDDGCLQVLNEENSADVYVSLSFHEGSVVCLPTFESKVLVYNENTDVPFEIDCKTKTNMLPIMSRQKWSYYYLGCVSNDKYLIVLPKAGRDFFVLDKTNGSIKEITPIIDDFKRKAYEHIKGEGVCRESEEFGISEYLGLL